MGFNPLKLGSNLLDFAWFAGEGVKKDMNRLDPYTPGKPLFKDQTHLPHMKGFKKTGAAVGRIEKELKNNLKKETKEIEEKVVGSRFWPGAIAGASLVGVGLSLPKIQQAMANGIHTIYRKNAYEKYLEESGRRDTTQERELFDGAYRLNPTLMSHPYSAVQVMEQLKEYGGLNLNSAKTLAMSGKSQTLFPGIQVRSLYGGAKDLGKVEKKPGHTFIKKSSLHLKSGLYKAAGVAKGVEEVAQEAGKAIKKEVDKELTRTPRIASAQVPAIVNEWKGKNILPTYLGFMSGGLATSMAAGGIKRLWDRHASDIAYDRYLRHTGEADTPTRHKLFTAAYQINSSVMGDPNLAHPIMKQLERYGGLDLNSVNMLAGIVPGTEET